MVKECNVIKEIRKNSTREKEVVQALEKQDRSTWEEDKVVYMEGRIYVPNNKRIREEILKENHNSVDVGHLELQDAGITQEDVLVARIKGRCQEIHTEML